MLLSMVLEGTAGVCEQSVAGGRYFTLIWRSHILQLALDSSFLVTINNTEVMNKLVAKSRTHTVTHTQRLLAAEESSCLCVFVRVKPEVLINR